MPLDRRARRLLDMLEATRGDPSAEASPTARREALSNFARMVDDGSEAVGAVEQHQASGPAGPIDLRLYSPLAAPAGPLPALMFLHGGGWVAGGLDTHDGLCRRLANQARCRVIAVDYRLAPEHRFPAAIEDGMAALRWIAEHAPSIGVDPSRLAVGGDSAGAGLAAVICQLARGDGGPRIALQVLICPILDVFGESASRHELGEGYFISQKAFQRDVADYCPAHADRSDPRLSPLNAPDLTGLPPTILHTAEFDPFRDEGQAYASRLAQAGVSVQSVCHARMIHYFYAMPRAIPYALTAGEMIGAHFQAMMAAAAH